LGSIGRNPTDLERGAVVGHINGLLDRTGDIPQNRPNHQGLWFHEGSGR